MKLSALLLAALCVPASAQYFSEGWAPGKAVPTATQAAPAFDPSKHTAAAAAAPPAQADGFLGKLLTTGPLGTLLGRAGVNVTERLAAAQQSLELWDPRIPIISDDNYKDIIVNEELTEEEERDRVWFLVMCVILTSTWYCLC